ncbi:MAG TPA: hypothetical protein VL049_17265 [Candidatus Dormibacteraeota bacterium]|nr:hypothetical protein [Candidatus Dormibacteraeota bacterium]
MRPPAPTPGLLYTLSLAAVGCLAFAVFTDEWLWVAVALLGAIGFATWAWHIAKRLYRDSDSGPALPL